MVAFGRAFVPEFAAAFGLERESAVAVAVGVPVPVLSLCFSVDVA